MAFTPDLGYTICNREKGILQFQVNTTAADACGIDYTVFNTMANTVNAVTTVVD